MHGARCMGLAKGVGKPSLHSDLGFDSPRWNARCPWQVSSAAWSIIAEGRRRAHDLKGRRRAHEGEGHTKGWELAGRAQERA